MEILVDRILHGVAYCQAVLANTVSDGDEVHSNFLATAYHPSILVHPIGGAMHCKVAPKYKPEFIPLAGEFHLINIFN